MALEKSWKKDFEKPIIERWKKEKLFGLKGRGRLFSIDTPPPYVNTPVHIGHATTYALMDMFARFRRMTGCNVLFPLGLDRNGLPIEIAAEKRFGVSLAETPREQFIELCEKILEEASSASIDSFFCLGISFNSWEKGSEPGDVYFTDSPEYRALTQSTFIDLWEKGLIYEDARINNYCTGCGTTLADDEIAYEELPSIFNYIKFVVKETGKEIIIGTTRPELICTCGMVIFNPEDGRYKHLAGKTAVTPLFSKSVPIMPHPMAEMEKGTGLAMMCSAGDQSDIRFFREMGIEPVIAIEKDGKMNSHAGFLAGMSIRDARKKIIEELRSKGILIKQEKVMHRTPVCERSKHEIEFIAMPEFYLKQVEFRDDMRKLANEINFFDQNSRQILLDWIDSVSIDWAISRRRYYATEIPLWYCKGCGKAIAPEKGKYYQPWREPAPLKRCSCGYSEFRGEERVLDTWFDSSISPLYILKYPGEFFSMHAPCTLRPQGKEIVRNWLYYTMLHCWLVTGKRIFRDVWINYHVVDESGKKMSKSLGNVIDPREVLDKYGAEPFRLWCAVEGNLERHDFRCSFSRIEGAGKTLTKLWNIARFVAQFEKAGKPDKPEAADECIISEINDIIRYTRECYEKYDFHNPVIRIKHFIWETFASHYLELAKPRAYNNQGAFNRQEHESAAYAMNYCLETILKLLAPVIPMFTHKVYYEMAGKEIHKEAFPEPRDAKPAFSSNDIAELNTAVWKAKKEAALSLKAPVKKLTLPDKLKPAEKDIKACHNAEEIVYGEKIVIEV